MSMWKGAAEVVRLAKGCGRFSVSPVNLAKVKKPSEGVLMGNLPKVKKPSEGKKEGKPSEGKMGILFIGLLMLVMLSACTVSLAEDITPPPGAQAPLQTTPSPAAVNLPFVPPDPASGGVIYRDKCAPCHGVSGKGDGVQAGNLASAPPAIGTPEVARLARPVDWFAIIESGHLAKFMPSTSGSLSDRQRWDVLAYVFNLSVTLNDISTGMEVYRQECRACHGEKGRGDGPQAASLNVKPPDWSDPAELAQKSLQELFDVTRQGNANGMPAYAS
jgi:mono/diheme cytochrome c family protein